MQIILSPQQREGTLMLQKEGDVLAVNGEMFDFSPMGPGDTLPVAAITSTWFVADVERTTAGELVLTVRLPIGADPTHEQAYPEPLLNVADGPVPLPTDEVQP